MLIRAGTVIGDRCVVGSYVDIEGDAKPLPRFRTRAKMLWDDEFFYVAAELDEPHVWATLTQHDAVIFQDNDFEVFLNPDGNNHNYAELEMNALNTTWDLRLRKPYRDGGKAEDRWDIPGLKTAVHVNGTVNVNRVPRPAADDSSTVPCSDSTRFLTTSKPTPRPETSVMIDAVVKLG